jgi:hypothetical protein
VASSILTDWNARNNSPGNKEEYSKFIGMKWSADPGFATNPKESAGHRACRKAGEKIAKISLDIFL